MRAAIYARQSIDHAVGAEDQQRRATALIDARGWTLADAYVDNDTSATRARGAGTGWARLLTAIENGHIEAVVAVDLDRLLRSTRDLNSLIDRGAKVVTVDGEIDLSSAEGEFRATMLASIARFEVRRKHERSLRGNERRAAAGIYRNGPRPFGYAEDHTALHPVEAPLVQEAYARALEGGTLYSIAADWNRRGIPTHRGGKGWSTPAVKALLLRERNVCRVVLRGELQTGVVGQWEPIIDLDTFEEVKARLTDSARRTAPVGRRAKYLAGGIAVCGVCGEPMRTNASFARKGKKVMQYRCSSKLRSASGTCATALVEQVDPLLCDAVYDALIESDDDTAADATTAQLIELRGLRNELERRRQVIQEELLEPDADRAHLRTLRRQIAAQIEACSARIEELEAHASKDAARDIVRLAREHLAATAATAEPWTPRALAASLAISDAWREWWNGLEIERQRDLIRATLTITINPARNSARPPVMGTRPAVGGGLEFVTLKPARPGVERVAITPKRKTDS